MSIPESTRNKLYVRAGGFCECTMTLCAEHLPGIRCFKPLGLTWEAHHRSGWGGDDLGNLLAMCPECHKNTLTYGRPRS